MRTSNGQFTPGTSGNPGGRPKLPELLRDKGPEAAAKLVELMHCGDAALEFRAATTILDRVYGKAPEVHEDAMTESTAPPPSIDLSHLSADDLIKLTRFVFADENAAQQAPQ